MATQASISFRLRRWRKTLAHHWLAIVLALGLPAGVSVWWAYRQPDVFLALSQIALSGQVVSSNTAPAETGDYLTAFYDASLRSLNSSRLLAVVEKESGPRPPGDFRTTAQRTQGAFLLTVESTHLAYGRDFARRWARAFVAEQNKIAEEAHPLPTGNRDELTRVSAELEKATADLDAFRKTNNAVTIKESISFAEQRVRQLQSDRDAVKSAREQLEKVTREEIANGAQAKLLSPAGKPGTPASIEGPARFTDLSQRLRAKQEELAVRARVMRPKHPFIVRLTDEVQALQREIGNQLDSIEIQRQARIKSLREEESSYASRLETAQKEIPRLLALDQTHERLSSRFTQLQARANQLRPAAQAEAQRPPSRFALIEAGAGSNRPIRPDRAKIISVGLATGLAVSVLVSMLLLYREDRLELAEEIETELQLPMLGQIPSHALPKKGLPLLITHLDQQSMFAEAFRGVRSAITFSQRQEKHQVLIVSSAAPGDGKTTVAANFALTLATAGFRVLLIDADLRRGTVHTFFELSQAPGLAEILLGKIHWTEVARNSAVPTLQIISTGELPDNPGELLAGPIVGELLTQARASYNYVILDCPPLTAIDDTFDVLGHADGLLFVVRAGRTSMRFARNAVAAVRKRGTRILGVVLNAISSDNPHYYYRQFYHAYYRKDSPAAGDISTVPMPAQKMAAPKGILTSKFASIDAEAKAYAAGRPPAEGASTEEKSKMEQFRARRAAQKPPTE